MIKDLSERVHKCPYCGFVAPRDYNSALEIKKLTLKKIFFGIGQGLPESTLVEMEALPPTLVATAVKEARTFHKAY